MIGYPLDSIVKFNNGVPEYDRAISSAPLRELIKRLYSDGVLPDRSTELLVQYVGTDRVDGDVEGAVETYNVVVNPGFGICNGCLKLQENYYGLEVSIANTTNPRIDTVVLRLDDNADIRSCTFDIVQGVEAPAPVAPTLTRNSTIWEIGLANIYKPATVSTSSPIIVTDTRVDPERCGIISSIGEFDISAMYNQVQKDLMDFQIKSEAEFTTWFNNLQTQLSGDVASNLQLQIGVLSQLSTVNQTNLVDAINEVIGGGGTAITPTRTVRAVSSQSLLGNPIPTSWQQVVAGMMYTGSGYTITASRFEEGNEAFKAFDGNPLTYWGANTISGASLVVEFPSPILIDQMVLLCSTDGAYTYGDLQYSSDGYTWRDVTEFSIYEDGDEEEEEVGMPGYTAKYWRLNFPASGNRTVKVYKWALADYTITTYEVNFIADSPVNMVNGQVILVHIDPTHDATGVVSNTLNGLPIHSVLQAGKKYKLMYHTTHYTAEEVI